MEVVIDGRWWHAVGATAVSRRIPPDALGLTPKAFARVARARRAAEALANGASPGTVAMTCGYADQAHLTRELGELHGVTPANVRNVQDGAAAPA